MVSFGVSTVGATQIASPVFWKRLIMGSVIIPKDGLYSISAQYSIGSGGEGIKAGWYVGRGGPIGYNIKFPPPNTNGVINTGGLNELSAGKHDFVIDVRGWGSNPDGGNAAPISFSGVINFVSDIPKEPEPIPEPEPEPIPEPIPEPEPSLPVPSLPVPSLPPAEGTDGSEPSSSNDKIPLVIGISIATALAIGFGAYAYSKRKKN